MRLVMNLEERMFFMVALVMFQFILMVFVLESPSYLVMKRKFEVRYLLSLIHTSKQDILKLLVKLSDVAGDE